MFIIQKLRFLVNYKIQEFLSLPILYILLSIFYYLFYYVPCRASKDLCPDKPTGPFGARQDPSSHDLAKHLIQLFGGRICGLPKDILPVTGISGNDMDMEMVNRLPRRLTVVLHQVESVRTEFVL